jgi:hypothetical protein
MLQLYINFNFNKNIIIQILLFTFIKKIYKYHSALDNQTLMIIIKYLLLY